MDKIIIACEMLKDELSMAIAITGCGFPVIWIDSDYHRDPALLQEKLQEKIDTVENAKDILLAYGCCGNAMIGIKATAANLIIPKTDDCISMILSKENEGFKRVKKTYFLTKGWIDSPRSLVGEYRRALEKYGKERTDRIFKLMFNSYKNLMLIDTKAYDIQEYKAKAEGIAHLTNLSLVVESGSIWFLKKLLTGPYDENFCIVPKGDKVKLSCFGYSEDNISNTRVNI